MIKNKKASIFIYILIIVSISLVLGLVVFNNSITLTNNLNIGENGEEVFTNLTKKASIAIDTVRKYNNDGGGFSDNISCPTNVTMSGSTSSGTNINTSLVNIYGSIYCSGDYNSDKFRIYFTEDKTNFKSAYYNSDLVDLQYDSSGSPSKWIGVNNFNTDNTLISFTDDGTLDGDNIDDNFDSDDYTVASTGNLVYYPNGFADDDVIPRKIIFGNVPAYTDLYNIFWNNYKTTDFIDKNINNDDIINKKIGLVSSGALFLDLYTIGNYNYNIKILEFNRNDYKNKYTLLPITTSEGRDLTDFVGYIQKSSTGTLSLSKYKTGNEYEFDFANKDYGIFISNKDSKNLSYRISGEELTGDINTTGSGIYINPIDDSGTGTISVMSNHMIIDGDKNFIGENFIVTEPK